MSRPGRPPVRMHAEPAPRLTRPAGGGSQATSNRKRPAEAPQDAAPISCLICTDPFDGPGDPNHIKPCSVCDNDYCIDCVEDMFRTALKENDRMPARCCAPIQLYMILSSLPEDLGQQYREKFTEWLLPDKLYCPVPTCSAFIHEKHIPFDPKSLVTRSLKDTLLQILDKVRASPASRFFRTGIPQSDLPNYKKIITKPIDLGTIENRITAPGYKTVEEFMAEFDLLAMNAEQYNKATHPVTEAARQVQGIARTELSRSVDRLVQDKDAPPSPQKIFACPACHIAICSKCRKVGHEGQCNLTADDQELAMLETFGYKRCPRCSHAVKKMYGCPHMNCICGAHFCWNCLKSMSECPGGCGAGDEDEDEEGYDDGGTSEPEDAVERPRIALPLDSAPQGGSQTTQPRVYTTTHVNLPGGPVPIFNVTPVRRNATVGVSPSNDQPGPTGESSQQSSDPQANGPGRRIDSTADANAAIQPPLNLDAGGARRWAEADEDFGDEPEDDYIHQIWSCRHQFLAFEYKNDGCRRGDLSRMECNRCWRHVVVNPVSGAQKPGKRRKTAKQASTEDVEVDAAMECRVCSLVVCGDCKERYEVEEKRRPKRAW